MTNRYDIWLIFNALLQNLSVFLWESSQLSWKWGLTHPSMRTWHWIVETVWDHATASLSLKPVRILTRSDMLAHRKKQMGMFQFNAIPGGWVTMKTQDFGLMSGRIMGALFQPCSLWHDPSRRFLTDKCRISRGEKQSTENVYSNLHSPTKPKQHIWSKLSKDQT